MAYEDFASVPDAPTHITDTEFVPAADGQPAYCSVTGRVSKTIGFALNLPAMGWNGKFLQYGCGGFCGSYFITDPGRRTADALRRGYAALNFDAGNPGGPADASWAKDDIRAQFDFGIRSPHVVALAGKAIVERYYAAAPKRSYFMGCSTGGGQALSLAQRFPWDFDGIIAGAPSPTFSGWTMNYLWAGRALAGIVGPDDLKLVHGRAVAMCDMDDGVRDGVIGDPINCKFDPGAVLCKSDQTSNCLSTAKVDAIRKVYAGPVDSRGQKVYVGGPLPGSELGWVQSGKALGVAYANDDGPMPWAQAYFSNIGFFPAPGSKWKVEDFDFDRDPKRLRMAESLIDAADNPDLRKFKAAGGRMILYQGLQDQSDVPSETIDYYETVERTMGGRAATRDFFRMFLIPGMNHCGGGPGASAIDYLAHLEAWVEKGQAPDRMVAAHVKDPAKATTFPLDPAVVEFTRPIYPYPVRARYKGRGDPHDASSFVPVEPVSR